MKADSNLTIKAVTLKEGPWCGMILVANIRKGKMAPKDAFGSIKENGPLETRVKEQYSRIYSVSFSYAQTRFSRSFVIEFDRQVSVFFSVEVTCSESDNGDIRIQRLFSLRIRCTWDRSVRQKVFEQSSLALNSLTRWKPMLTHFMPFTGIRFVVYLRLVFCTSLQKYYANISPFRKCLFSPM